MSTRFSQWRNTDYVGLPTETYLQSGLVQDQRIETELQKSSAALAEYKSLQAVGANAQAYQNQIMSELKTRLEGLAKENLKSPDALMKMQSIIADPTFVGGLKQIAKDTEYFKLAQKAAMDYEKESGNRINATPFYRAYNELMNETGDPTKFNATRFAGMESVPKYLEIQKEVDAVIKEMKPGTRVWDYTKGVYDVIKTREELTPDRILNAVQHEFRSRKDIQSQLQRNIEYDSYSSGNSTIERGTELRNGYATAYDNVTRELDSYKTNPTAFKKKYKLSSDEDVQSTIAALENQRKQYDSLRTLDPRTLLAQKAISDSAMASASVFAYTKDSMKQTANPLRVIDYRAMKAQQQIDELTKLANGNTAIVDMGLQFAENAAEVDKKIENNDFIRELIGSAGIDVSKYETPEQTKARLNMERSPRSNWEALAQQDKKRGIIYSTNWFGNAPDFNNPQLKKLVGDLAQKFGYREGLSSEKNPIDFLKNVYRKGNHMGVGVINSNFDSERITKGIATGAGNVYINNKLVTDAEKTTYLNMLNNPTNESKGINLSKSATPIISVRMDGKPVANYRHPVTGDMISYELPGELSRGMAEVGKLMQAKSDINYGFGKNKPITIEIPGIQTTKGEVPGTAHSFTAARINDGTNNLVMFKDADNPRLVTMGIGLIHKVASAMADYDINKYPDNEKVKLYNKAIEKINSQFESNIKRGSDGNIQLIPGLESTKIQVKNRAGVATWIDLGAHIFIPNRSIDKLEDLGDIKVGIADEQFAIKSGKGYIRVGGTFSENDVGSAGLRKYGQNLIN